MSITSPLPAPANSTAAAIADLTPAELAQIAGRAGRHLNDGTFGVTADVEPFDQELINKLENHDFEPVKVLQWRNNQLDFDSIERLKDSLRRVPDRTRGSRAQGPPTISKLWSLRLTIRASPSLPSRPPPSSGCGRFARFPITAKSRRTATPSWWRRSTSTS